MNTKRLNVAMRPTKELAEYMYKTVKELGQYGEMLFELDGVLLSSCNNLFARVSCWIRIENS